MNKSSAKSCGCQPGSGGLFVAAMFPSLPPRFSSSRHLEVTAPLEVSQISSPHYPPPCPATHSLPKPPPQPPLPACSLITQGLSTYCVLGPDLGARQSHWAPEGPGPCPPRAHSPDESPTMTRDGRGDPHRPGAGGGTQPGAAVQAGQQGGSRKEVVPSVGESWEAQWEGVLGKGTRG